MSPSTKRTILRTIHIVLAIPIAGYVYSPFEDIPQYAGPTRFVFFPVLVLTGLWIGRAMSLHDCYQRTIPLKHNNNNNIKRKPQ